MKKKLFSVMLVAAMVASTLAGCGSTAETTEPAAEEAAATRIYRSLCRQSQPSYRRGCDDR